MFGVFITDWIRPIDQPGSTLPTYCHWIFSQTKSIWWRMEPIR